MPAPPGCSPSACIELFQDLMEVVFRCRPAVYAYECSASPGGQLPIYGWLGPCPPVPDEPPG